VCSVPLIIGGLIGAVEIGLVVALAMAICACCVAGARWLLPVMFAFLPFQQSIVPAGINVAASDVVNGCLLLLLLGRINSVATSPAVLPLLFYLMVSTLASIVNWSGGDTAISLLRMLATTLVPLLVFSTFDRKGWAIGPSLTFYLLSTTVLAGFVILAFITGGVGAAMYTLGLHKNAMGTTFAVAVVALAAPVMLRVMPVPLSTAALILGVNVVALLLTLSRGGWIACCSGLLLLLLLTRRIRLAIAAAIPAIVALAAVWQFVPEDSQEYATNIGFSAGTVKSRLQVIEYVLEQFQNSPLVGVGIGLRKSAEPHNMLILSLGETGLLGTFGFLLAVAAGFYTCFKRNGDRGQTRYRSAIRTTGAAILLVTLAHGMFDVYWRRGVAAAGWAAVGMAAVASRRSGTL
jgi:O-antigen ligase